MFPLHHPHPIRSFLHHSSTTDRPQKLCQDILYIYIKERNRVYLIFSKGGRYKVILNAWKQLENLWGREKVWWSLSLRFWVCFPLALPLKLLCWFLAVVAYFGNSCRRSYFKQLSCIWLIHMGEMTNGHWYIWELIKTYN